MPKNSQVLTVDLTATIIHETDQAFLLRVDDKSGWVPKALVEWNGKDTFTMPEWLAIQKEFV